MREQRETRWYGEPCSYGVCTWEGDQPGPIGALRSPDS